MAQKPQRISPGVYRTAGGKTIHSTTQPGATNPGVAKKKAPTAPKVPNTFKLPNQERDIYNQQNQGSQSASDIAFNQLQNSGFNDPFSANLTDRTDTGNTVEDRKRMEDEVFGRLTRGQDEQKKKDQDQLAQDLQNRGIPVGSEQYNSQMKEFNNRYDTMNLDARAQATQMGGEEWQRQFGVQEQRRSDQLAEQQAQRNQRLNETGAFQQMGNQGLGNYNQLQQTRNQTRQLNEAIRQSKRSGKGKGGGGGRKRGGSGGYTPSPFVNSPPPGYTG